eukprot:scaffold2607_cov254-Pinguiococcus_pyrenoidosus.AAC.8
MLPSAQKRVLHPLKALRCIEALLVRDLKRIGAQHRRYGENSGIYAPKIRRKRARYGHLISTVGFIEYSGISVRGPFPGAVAQGSPSNVRVRCPQGSRRHPSSLTMTSGEAPAAIDDKHSREGACNDGKLAKPATWLPSRLLCEEHPREGCKACDLLSV